MPLKFPSASLCVCLIVLSLASPGAHAESLTVAVASNFSATARELATAFEAQSGTDVRLSVGSTGKLFAQIAHGAPYDVFLAADTERPRALEAKSLIAPGSRFAYATGALVLWSAEGAVENCLAYLDVSGRDKIAIANPAHAPYGMVAFAHLKEQHGDESFVDKLVYGENIAQTYQFVATGNAAFGFIALSQLSAAERATARCVIRGREILRQEAVILARAANSSAAEAFARFLQSAEARDIIASHGYELPE